MSTTDSELVELARSAVLASLQAVSRQAMQDLVGYALCTDDCLTTLYAAWVTTHQLEQSTEPELLFSPTDWPDSSGIEFEAVVAQLVRRQQDTPDLLHHVDTAFAALVASLADLKRDGVFQSSVFLSVLSTDPSNHLEQLERGSVETLNDVALSAARQRFVERWSPPKPGAA